MNRSDAPVAVVDSGAGGITVLSQLARIMPHEDIIYYGDSANAPYGTKTHEQVRGIMLENVEKLLDMGMKALVVACNTATGAAVGVLREKYPEMPIVGIEPAIKPALEVCDKPTVVVMATPLTLTQEKFLSLKERFCTDGEIIALPCPGLMELIEQGHIDDAPVREYIREVFEPLKDKHIDAVVLGCTHYPLIKRVLGEHFGTRVAVLDGGEGTAREARRRIVAAGLENTKTERGKIEFISTDGDESKTALYKYFMEEYK